MARDRRKVLGDILDYIKDLEKTFIEVSGDRSDWDVRYRKLEDLRRYVEEALFEEHCDADP